jgi:hypothetical protein
MRALDLDVREVHSARKGDDGLDGARLNGAPNQARPRSGFFLGFFHAKVRTYLRTGADEDETRPGFRDRCDSDDLQSGAGSSGRLSRGPREGKLFDLAEGRAQDERRGDRDASLRPGDVLLWRQYQKAGRAHLSLAVTEKQGAEVEEPG